MPEQIRPEPCSLFTSASDDESGRCGPIIGTCWFAAPLATDAAAATLGADAPGAGRLPGTWGIGLAALGGLPGASAPGLAADPAWALLLEAALNDTELAAGLAWGAGALLTGTTRTGRSGRGSTNRGLRRS